MKKLFIIFLIWLFFLPLGFAEDTHYETKSEIKLSKKTINTLKKYIKKEEKVPADRTEEYLSNFIKYPDIGLEFEKWVVNREYETENPIKIEGYTAKDISELAPFMSGLGVYNFMVSLRDYPIYALAVIKQGFPLFD